MATVLSMQDYEYDFGPVSPSVSGPENKPRSLAELDIRQSIVEDLVLKILYLSGALSCV